MPKKKKEEKCDCGCSCCGGRGRFWWGVLAGVVVAVVVNMLVCHHGCKMMGGNCAMDKAAPAQVQAQKPVKK